MRIVGRIQIGRGCTTFCRHFWPPLLAATFWGHFWPPLFGATFGRHFWGTLLNATFGGHFWPPLLGATFGRHFWGPLSAATFGGKFWPLLLDATLGCNFCLSIRARDLIIWPEGQWKALKKNCTRWRNHTDTHTHTHTEMATLSPTRTSGAELVKRTKYSSVKINRKNKLK